MKAKQLDDKFDRGEDIMASLDLAAMRRPGLEARRVNVDFPAWMVTRLTARPNDSVSPASRSSRCGSPNDWNTAAAARHSQHYRSTRRHVRFCRVASAR